MSVFNIPQGDTALGLIGRSFGKGVGQGLQANLNEFHERKQALEKGRPQVLSHLNSLMKFGGLSDTYDEAHKDRLLKRATQLLESGVDPFSAADQALGELTSGTGIFAERAPTKTKAQSLLSQPITQPFKEASQSIAERNQEALQQERERGVPEQLKSKPIELMTPQELLSLPSEYITSLPMGEQLKVGKKIAEQQHAGAGFQLLKGADPTGAFAALERKLGANSPIPPLDTDSKIPAEILSTLGSFLPATGILNLAAKAPTVLGKAATAAAGFGAEAGLKKAVGEGETPTFGDILLPAAFGAIFPVAEPLLKAAWTQLKRIPSLFKTVETAAKSSGIPAETIVKEAAESLASKEDRIAKAVGRAGTEGLETQVAPEAAEQSKTALQQRAVDVIDRASKGEPQALNALQKEATKIADTHQRADKFSQKEIEKVRAETAKKLPESPLEEYYKPEKEVSHRPETILKEQERVAELEKRIKPLERSLKNNYYSMLTREQELAANRATMSPQALERVQAGLDLERMHHQRILNEIRNIEFEIKHKKPRITSDELQKQIANQHEKMRGLIHEPNAEAMDKIRKRIADDERAIQTAEKLAARGKLPGPEVRDEFIKIHEEYGKAYKELAKELKDFVKEHKGEKEFASKVKNAQDVLKVVEDADKVNAAKVAIQKDKRLAKLALERPSGAFYKQQLKDLRSDVEAFKKNFFKTRQATAPEELKTAKKAGELIKKPEEAKITLEGMKKSREQASKAVRNPTSENVKKVAEDLGESEEKIAPAIKKLREEARAGAQKVEAGEATEKDVNETAKSFLKEFRKMSPLKRGVIVGPITGILQGLSEEYFGFKPTQAQVGVISGTLATGGQFTGRGLAAGTIGGSIASFVYKGIHNAYNHKEAEKLASYRNSPKFASYYKELTQRYSKARADKIKKEALGQ